MGREFLILWAGRHQRRAWEELCTDYRRRIAREMPIRDQPVKVRAAGEGLPRLRDEGRALIAALPDPCWTIALDRRGRMLSSEELAVELRRLKEEWPHPIAFLIGSDLGLDQGLVRQARERISFGPMTLGHELARLVLYEQLYRALALDRGIKYHRQRF
ncbi:MAG: 23S rRNA (pseudouridine(1915)-N(3))-methyltransferase RlmH [bacterium]|nr:23S rRNA (pseudouridine(1915)-N(3))-methyltransferase RlmH [bacterium]